MKKFVFAAIATVALTGFVVAEDLTVSISKVDAKAGTITYAKFAPGAFGGKKKGGDAGDAKAPEPVTAKISKDCKIAKGEIDKDAAGDKGGAGAKKGGFGGFAYKAGDVLEKGLDNDAFKPNEEKKGGVFARITVADEDKGSVKKGDVTQILVLNFGGLAKGGKKGGGDQ